MKWIRVTLFAFLTVSVAACASDAAFVDGPRLVDERTLEPPAAEALPTLFTLPTETPLIAPTATQTALPVATEVDGVAIATAEQGAAAPATPTLQPSKTPTVTPTHTIQPTTTTTPTTTVTASPTVDEQFTFGGEGQTSNADATRIAQIGSTGGNPLVYAPQQQLPAANCTSTQWFYTQFAPPDCPVEQPITGSGVFQRFEYGYMIWLEHNDKIYIMYNTAESPRWQIFDDPYVEGAEELDYAWHTYEQQPPQTWQPRRGFGEVWRNFDPVRFRIGWTVQQWETIYTPRYQRGADGTVSIEDPSGGVFYLLPRGSDWQLHR